MDGNSANMMNNMSAVELQQQYFEAIGDADWELYEKKDRHFLLQKVAVALCGPPTGDGDLSGFGHEVELQGYPSLRDREKVMTIFNKICEQAKYSHNGENILISVLRILCVVPAQESAAYSEGYWIDLHEKKGRENVSILMFHVFAIRKCISMKHGVKSCKKFIDHDGRVYQNWESYLTENKLPKCVMVVPENGEYKGEFRSVPPTDGDTSSNRPVVKISVVPSPALGIGAKILGVTDKTTIAMTAVSLAAVAGAATLAPVALPIAMTSALMTGAVASVYGIVRSSLRLSDRAKHEQDIGLQNTESLKSWLNIAVSFSGLATAAAGRLFAWAIATGTSSEILINAVQFLNYSNNFTSAVGALNILADMENKYKKYRELPNTSDYFHLSVSALFYGLGVISNQTAKEIVQSAQPESINSVRKTLASNTIRKIIDKVVAETRGLQENFNGSADIVKALNKIENKEDFFEKLGRIYEQANKNIRIPSTPDPKTLVNNEYSVSLSKLYKLPKSVHNNLFGELCQENVFGIKHEHIIKVASFVSKLNNDDTDIVARILSKTAKEIHEGFLLVCAELTDMLLEEIETLKDLWPNFELHVILFVFNYFQRTILKSDDTDSYIAVMKTMIQDGKINRQIIDMLRKNFANKVAEVKNSSYDDPNRYDDYENFCLNNKDFSVLSAENVIKLGNHEVLIKFNTIEMFEKRLNKYDLLQRDFLIAVIYNIVKNLSNANVEHLIRTNPDEDLMMRVSQCIFEIANIEVLVSNMSDANDCSRLNNEDIASFLKNVMITQWLPKQYIRKYIICKRCEGNVYA